MGKKTNNLKRAASLMARYINKGAIFTNQQRDIILSCVIAFLVAYIPINEIYKHRQTDEIKELVAKEKQLLKEMQQNIAASDSINISNQ